jgi:DNA mismatch repair protein MutL
LKFLKSLPAEAAVISETAARAALSRPDIAFKFINNGSIGFQTNGNGLLNTVEAVYGAEAAKHMVEINYDGGTVKLTGVISRPEFNRPNRKFGSFFINNRPVRSDVLQRAVESAYRSRLQNGRFPAFALYIEIAPDAVDVNVHPSKLEVKFADEFKVFDAAAKACEGALKGRHAVADVREIAKPRTEQVSQMKAEYRTPVREGLPDVTYINLDNYKIEKTAESAEKSGKTLEKAEDCHVEKDIQVTLFEDYLITGQIFASYWLVERGESMFIIDQHAAHERILFEKFRRAVGSDAPALRGGDVRSDAPALQVGSDAPALRVETKQLTIPLPVTLSPTEEAVLNEHLAALNEMGFEIEYFGDKTYAVRAVPFVFGGDSVDYLYEILSILAREGSDERIFDKVAMAACKAAVKANAKMTRAEAKAIIERLLTLQNPFRCPHGRPTVVELRKRDIEKLFLRV